MSTLRRGWSRLTNHFADSQLPNQEWRHQWPKETRSITFYIFLFISIQIKNKFLRNTSRGEAERWSGDPNQEFEGKEFYQKESAEWKFQLMLGLFDSTCGPRRGRLFRRLSEAEDSASRFFGAFFLSQVWWRYLSRIFFFSVMMTESGWKIKLLSSGSWFYWTHSVLLEYLSSADTPMVASSSTFWHCQCCRAKSSRSSRLADLWGNHWPTERKHWDVNGNAKDE